MLCAGANTIGTVTPGICEATRGSGLYCNELFVGIASNGFSCGLVTNAGIYTQVNIF